MNRYYILLSDELGESFSVYMYSDSLEDCLDKIAYEYPESCVRYVAQHMLEPRDAL
jgi:hypothetical protein